MDPRDQFTLKAASVARRVRAFELTDEHIWRNEPIYQHPAAERAHAHNSLAAKLAHVTEGCTI